MQLRIRLFAQLAEAARSGVLPADFPDGSTVGEVLEALQGRSDDLGRLLAKTPVAVSVNARLATPDVVIQEGDEVALLPPVSGG